MANINEKSTIPISWVAVIIAAFAGVLVTGTGWVYSVNARLGNIETALGLQNKGAGDLIQSANAEMHSKKPKLSPGRD